MVVKCERQLGGDIRRTTGLVSLLEPKQHRVPNEEFHCFVTVNHMDSIVVLQGTDRMFYDLFPDKIRAATFAPPDAVEIAGQPVVPCLSDRGYDMIADFVQNWTDGGFARNRHAWASLVLREDSRVNLQKQHQNIHATIQAG